ncbi:MAG: hypothetical protein KGL39_30375 [Patescibacteria group bacterium]|nr:hypothetical protein [Patescibacteria group bacterium]
MTEIKIGDRARDNDPRPGFVRTMYVIGFVQHVTRGDQVRRAMLGRRPDAKKHETLVRVDRIHTDGKPWRSGWSLVP